MASAPTPAAAAAAAAAAEEEDEEESESAAPIVLAGKSHLPPHSSSSSSAFSPATQRWQRNTQSIPRFTNYYNHHHHHQLPPPPSPRQYQWRGRETVINGTTWYPQPPRCGPNPNPRHYRDPHDDDDYYGSYQQHLHGSTMPYHHHANDGGDVEDDEHHDGSYAMYHTQHGHGNRQHFGGRYAHMHPHPRPHQHDASYAMMPYHDGGMYGNGYVTYNSSTNATPWYAYDHHDASPMRGSFNNNAMPYGSYDARPRGGGRYNNNSWPHAGHEHGNFYPNSSPRARSHGGTRHYNRNYDNNDSHGHNHNSNNVCSIGAPSHCVPNLGNTTRHLVSWCGHTMPVIITSQAAAVIEWVHRQTGGLFGFDLEWKPNFSPGQDNKAALLQLCGPEDCLIVQLLYTDMIPPALVDFLLDAGKSLGGVGIKQDVSKLERDHGLACQGQVELGVLASEKLQRRELHGVGLKKLVDQILGKTLVKVKKITMSNWEKEYLDEKQIEYACIDAWAALALLQKLMG